MAALNETAYSMIYSAIVLFCGFYIFTFSSFGGTEALGYLVSFTLLVALFANLLVLPALLLTMDKRAITKAFKKPQISIFNEEAEVIELDKLITEELKEGKDQDDKYTKL